MMLYLYLIILWYFFFFFKQKTAYEMRISDWSSDVCSSDLMRATVDRLIARMTIEEKAGRLSILGDDYGKVDDLARRGLLGGTNGVMQGHDVAVYTRHIPEMAMQSSTKIPGGFMGAAATIGRASCR